VGGPFGAVKTIKLECPFGVGGCSTGEAVETGLLFNSVEFDGIKTGVVDLLPEAEEFEGVAVAKPVADQAIAGLRVFIAGDVGQADIILVVHAGEANFAGEDFDFLRHWISRCAARRFRRAHAETRRTRRKSR
jgi:hypothetical protein